jgi:hypothetical protein
MGDEPVNTAMTEGEGAVLADARGRVSFSDPELVAQTPPPSTTRLYLLATSAV